jgi:hypothetical protein
MGRASCGRCVAGRLERPRGFFLAFRATPPRYTSDVYPILRTPPTARGSQGGGGEARGSHQRGGEPAGVGGARARAGGARVAERQPLGVRHRGGHGAGRHGAAVDKRCDPPGGAQVGEQHRMVRSSLPHLSFPHSPSLTLVISPPFFFLFNPRPPLRTPFARHCCIRLVAAAELTTPQATATVN